MVDEVVKLKDVYQDITDTVIAQLELGVIPWRKTWSQGSNEGFFPTNVTSGKSYRGWNVFWLNMNTQINGYTSSRYITYKQALACNGKVKKGEKGTRITYWLSMVTKLIPGSDGNDDTPGKAFMVPKIYTVFNIDQCEGLNFPLLEVIERSEEAKIIECELVISGMPNLPYIAVKGSQPCYIPAKDVVEIPHISQFEIGEYYYSALFHELAHATGHVSRLNRKEISDHKPGDKKAYANEELVAELTASFLNCVTGTVAKTIDMNTSYIKSWLEALRNDKKLVLTAAARAQKAADYILNQKPEQYESIEAKSVDTVIIPETIAEIPVNEAEVIPVETGVVVYKPTKQLVVNYHINTRMIKAIAAKFKTNCKLAILECIMIKNNQALFTDLFHSVVIKNVGIDSNELFVIKRSDLLFVLGAVPIPTVVVDFSTNKVVFASGNEEINFQTENPLDFPSFPSLDQYEPIGSIDNVLFDQIKIASKFLSKDDLRPSMMNVYVGDHVFGTDSHRMYFERVNHKLDKPILLSKKTIDIMRATDDIYDVAVSREHIRLSNNGITIYQHVVNENYPNCLGVIPTSHSTEVELETLPLINKLKIALLMADKTTHGVVFTFNSICGRISAEDQDNTKEYSSVLNYESFSGTSITIGFNGQFLLEILNICIGKKVKLLLDSENRAVIFNDKYLLMPVRIEEPSLN